MPGAGTVPGIPLSPAKTIPEYRTAIDAAVSLMPSVLFRDIEFILMADWKNRENIDEN
jgi:hypothetical protein